MRIIRLTRKNLDEQLAALVAESSLLDITIEERTRTILEDVRLRGDDALVELTARFDGASLLPEQFEVTKAEFLAASVGANASLREAVAIAGRNIERFSRRALRRRWSTRNAQGGQVGEKFDPFQRVGVYIPGGTAPLVSTALMTVTLARVAGCPEIAVCTPCARDGSIDSALLYAARAAGATEVYRLGGAQAIAAMAIGTRSIRPVQKVFGPGNAYVVAAKRLLFGRVAVDLLPGPSELMVLADDTAQPAWVAADLLAQAEHGSGQERVWLVTTSATLLARVRREVDRQLEHRVRREFIRRALRSHGALIRAQTVEQAVQVANRLAPEHCEVVLRNPKPVVEALTTVGAIFIGPFTPTVLGDYLAGPSHTLPTGGAGSSFAGLTVDQFQRRTSVVRYDRQSLRRSLGTILTFAGLEGLEAHGHSAAVRFEPRSPGNLMPRSSNRFPGSGKTAP